MNLCLILKTVMLILAQCYIDSSLMLNSHWTIVTKCHMRLTLTSMQVRHIFIWHVDLPHFLSAYFQTFLRAHERLASGWAVPASTTALYWTWTHTHSWYNRHWAHRSQYKDLPIFSVVYWTWEQTGFNVFLHSDVNMNEICEVVYSKSIS